MAKPASSQLAHQFKDQDLNQLQGAFESFWATRKPGQWVPKKLRQLAVQALAQGVPPITLQQLCRISASQLRSWQKHTPCTASDPIPTETTPRVFTVQPSPTPESLHECPISFQIGPWHIQLRNVDLK